MLPGTPSLVLIASADAADKDLWRMVLDSGGVVLAVLIVLIALSIACWAIIGAKTVTIGIAIRRSRDFVVTFRNSTRLGELYQACDAIEPSPARDMFRAGYEELDLILRERDQRHPHVTTLPERQVAVRPEGDGPSARPNNDMAAFENIERALRQAGSASIAMHERYVGFLATVGSAAPFIGLFGTVWGIMMAFKDIDTTKPILDTVTPHIAEALVATAIGLLAAIPAVMAYNWLVGQLKRLEGHLGQFTTDYLNILRRHFFS